MGALDNIKDAAEATAKKVGRAAEDAKDAISDRADEAKANSDVKKAEANRDAVEKKNDYKEDLRSN